MTTDYVDLTKMIITGVVDNPEAVTVSLTEGSRGMTVEVAVDDADMGKVIGKGGRNIDAIRSVVRAAGLRQHERVQVELVEDERPNGVADESADA